MRELARTLRGMFVALLQEGFSPSEAVAIVGAVLRASMGKG